MAQQDKEFEKKLPLTAIHGTALSAGATYSIDPNANQRVYSNKGAGGRVSWTLPSLNDAQFVGTQFTFVAETAQQIALYPGNASDQLSLAGVATTAGSYIYCNALQGACCMLVATAKNRWVDLVQRGTWWGI